MRARGFKLNPDKTILDVTPFNLDLFNDWLPDLDDKKLVSNRIYERIMQKPHLYPDKERFISYFNTLI